MNDQNIIHRMFAKGDAIRDSYNDFDYSKLENTQLHTLWKLSFFSRQRDRIIRKFNSTRIDYDAKITFLD